MSDTSALLKLIQAAGANAVEADGPCNILVATFMPDGLVVSPSVTIPLNRVIIPERLTNYETTVRLTGYNWKTETYEHTHNNMVPKDEHTHDLDGDKEIQIRGRLEYGDRVIAVKAKGGQQYFVLDRVGDLTDFLE